MNQLQKCWTWVGNSKNQKTLAFVGSGLAIIAGAFWQIYPHFFGADAPKAPAAQQITAMQGGFAVGNITGGNIHITNTQGVSEEKFQRLAGDLGVTQGALKSFFKSLNKRRSPRRISTTRCGKSPSVIRTLQAKLDSFSSDDPEVETLKRQAKEVLDAGDFERAEKLLNQASEKDIWAANELQTTAKKRLLSAAASKAANGALKYTQLAYVKAAAYYRQAAELVPAGEESTLAAYLFFQGTSLGTAGQYAEAVQSLERALALGEKALGPDHPDIALNLTMLATLYSAQDKRAEAEPLDLRALVIQEKALGPDHPNMAAILDSLANLWRDQSRYAEAEPLFQRALAIREKALGPDHLKVATVLEDYVALLKK